MNNFTFAAIGASVALLALAAACSSDNTNDQTNPDGSVPNTTGDGGTVGTDSCPRLGRKWPW